MRILQIVLLISICSLAAAAQPKKVYLSSTKNLPKIDKIKVYQLYWADMTEMDSHRNGERLAEKTLTGQDSTKISALWRKLEYRPGLSACHEPHFSVEFYSKGRLIVRASICWACDNILFSVPKINKESGFEENTQNFNADGKISQKLFEIFKATFAPIELLNPNSNN